MNVKQIVEKYLRENGYDGLYTDECGCCLDDLMPCDEFCLDCIAGYKVIITAKNQNKFGGEVEIGDWVICKRRKSE